MRKLFLLISVISMGLISCTEKNGLDTNGDPGVTVLNDVTLAKSGTAELNFTVNPSSTEFNYTVGNSACQISLKVVENAEGPVQETAPTYYKLNAVTKGSNGQYTATIKDLGKTDVYNEKAILCINAGGEDLKSEPFTVRLSGTALVNLKFTKEANETAVFEDIELKETSTGYEIESPLISSPELVLSFDTNGDKVFVGGTEQISGETVNDFSEPVTYKVISATGAEKTFTVKVTYSGLPVIFIKTKNNATIPDKHSDWLGGTEIKLYNPDWTIDYEATEDEIRGRGNSTWNYPKKPYAIKLANKAKILGMPKHKRWVLLANWMDRTCLRNRVSFAVSMKTGLDWTPHGEFVEVFINGEHKGNYYLCEQIKVDENRVNVDKLEDNITDGGYMFELDTYYDEVNKFKSTYYNLPYMFKDPDEVNSAQINFVKNFVNNMEYSLYYNVSSRDYTNYLDVDSFIDWWLVHELTGNEEPKHPKSSYMNKNTGGKLKMGPVWDFDWETFLPRNKWTILNRSEQGLNRMFDKLFSDPQFKARAKERWNSQKAGFEEIPAFIESEAARIKGSESMNWKMWPITADAPGAQGLVNGDEQMTFDQAVARMKKSYEDKLNWMNQQISNW